MTNQNAYVQPAYTAASRPPVPTATAVAPAPNPDQQVLQGTWSRLRAEVEGGKRPWGARFPFKLERGATGSAVLTNQAGKATPVIFEIVAGGDGDANGGPWSLGKLIKAQ